MADKEKTTEDQPILLQASNPGNSIVFGSPAVKHKLPLYLKNMLLACGYDTLDAIAELNVCESGSNDIDRMLEYVNNTFPQDQRLVATYYVHVFLAFITLIKLQVSSR